MGLDSDLHRHACEVRDLIRRYYPDSSNVKAYLDLVKAKRGDEAYNRLREDLLAEWQKKKAGE